jgi:hypothetical protein
MPWYIAGPELGHPFECDRFKVIRDVAAVLSVLSEVEAIGEQGACCIAALPGHGQAHIRLHTEREPLLFAAIGVFESPPLAACG